MNVKASLQKIGAVGLTIVMPSRPLLFVALSAFFLSGCGPSRPSTDTVELTSASTRDIGQPPPSWMLLGAGGLAYVNATSGGTVCSSAAAFDNDSRDDTTTDCQAAQPGAWVRIRKVMPKGDLKYVVAVTPSDRNDATRYMGAADLSPDIPAGTELVVIDSTPASTDDDHPSDSTPKLVDRNSKEIGELMDHTRVEVRRVFPDSQQTYAAVTVLSGEFRNRDGYIDIDDLNALTGDDDLTSFLGAAEIK